MTRVLAVCHPGGGTSGVFHDGARDAGAAIDEWTPADAGDPPRPLDDYGALVVLGGDQNVHERDRFPYLIDETQQTAKAYGAVCTPDFFGFDRNLTLQYRGRLDEGRTEPPRAGARRDLFEAMTLVAKTGQGPREQPAAVGCSIKWK